MTTGQERAWERSWEQWGTDLADLPDGPLATAEWFGRVAPVVLEIGSGMGESTALMALDAPEFGHLAVEVYQPGLAQLLLRIEQCGITNLRLLRGDAYQLLHKHLTEESLHAVRIYFPDPWPKRRHHKRRLIQPEFLDLAASRLTPIDVMTIPSAPDEIPVASRPPDITMNSRLTTITVRRPPSRCYRRVSATSEPSPNEDACGPPNAPVRLPAACCRLTSWSIDWPRLSRSRS